MIQFTEFPKIPRLSREMTVTEKIDGTNASIYIPQEGTEDAAYVAERGVPFLVGSRTRWITPESDNFGFARWAYQNADRLKELGPGHHFGEWWGVGIQRGYDLSERRFSLFNTKRWTQEELDAKGIPARVVPTLYVGEFSILRVQEILNELSGFGSVAAPGYMKPEGVVVFHKAAGQMFKKTLENDEQPKGKAA